MKLLLFILWSMSNLVGVPEKDTNVIILHEKLVNYNIENKTSIYYDYEGKENIKTILSKGNVFEAYNKDLVPDKYVRGKFTNWIHFRVNNPSKDTFFLCLEGWLFKDSIWVFKDGQMISVQNNAKSQKPNRYGIIKTHIISFSVLAIPPVGDFDIIIKDYHSQYSIGSIIPRLFNAYLFEGDYYARNFFDIFLFEGSVLVLLTFVIFFGFQAFLTRDKSMFWYAVYAFAFLIITFRNLETINYWFFSTKYWLSREDTRVFHTALVFFAYVRFLQEVLEIKSIPKLYRVFKYVYKFIIASVIIEIALLLLFKENEYYRYINFEVFRILFTTIGIFYLRVIYLSGSKYARYIMMGAAIMLIAEAISWFMSGNLGNIISLIGMYLEFIIFSIVLSMKSRDIIIANHELENYNQSLKHDNLNIAKNMESRIAKDLHDDIGGALISIKYLLQNSNLSPSSLDKSQTLIDEIQDNIRQQIFIINPENRILSEYIMELRSLSFKYCQNHNFTLVYDEKLSPSQLSKMIKGTSMRNIFMIIKELFNNTFKHSNGDKINLSILLNDENLEIHYADNGNIVTNLVVKPGNGLKNITKRVEEEEGSMSTQNQTGWHTILSFPLDKILESDV